MDATSAPYTLGNFPLHEKLPRPIGITVCACGAPSERARRADAPLTRTRVRRRAAYEMPEGVGFAQQVAEARRRAVTEVKLVGDDSVAELV